MTSQISDEFRRMQAAFGFLVNELNSTNGFPVQQPHDEETPIVREEQQMPGAFTFPATESSNGNNQEINNPSNASLITHKINKIFIIIFTGLVLIILIPLYAIYRIFIYIFFIIASLYKKIQKHSYKSLRSNDPTDIARRFIMRFDERIGNKTKNVILEENETNEGLQNNIQTDNLLRESHLVEIERPDFLECAYSHALYILKKDVRWLLCYIESDENKESIDFTNNVLINKDFLKFINDRNFLVWGGDISDSEAFQICNQFNITKLPFLGVLCLTVNQIPTSSGMRQSPPVLSLVAKIQGYKSLNEVLKKFDRAYKKYNPVVLQLQSNNSSLQGALRDLQGEALENSVRRNQQRIHESQQQNLEDLKSQWLKWRKSTLVAECTEAGEYARIAIKLPNGTRKKYKINKNCSLEEIYAHVECDLLNNVRIDNSINYDKPRNYNHSYKFDLYTVMPRHSFLPDINVYIYETTSVYPNGNLVVEMRE
jgi:FAS-associated factor 2